ncbi:bifunctional tRNA (5-methylaminomethyl-2-thiouridine)(34)-methyltransferase MnmD/FAD-dependent 5-carboxymethylaminomethyl-2-thiouridine(34) oxidoreductase MnmC [Marinobacter sp.]|jgi:tRNA 5-methylaminomethyl-2-thiouridine biosynthesis bifunctional protein|uniref:bifunctional tRNA (5-methylaminomethyl-2-thiouridine)(34)-methyltransferase MnmD/FAD-dependent 5-carboxymethylaminomethyl-2-thiouridine(34) oxidoreductase MnmC n=1 Tax=Marinobacter sp. TaxID=50741 RepID=UPI000C4FF009|nr:bifunctional tRNA (5-methylaminomethyl-2-thiouridine)(34)-methyltransferase MnmD/FAD-dependent 5-carboxymethylaminomethyl-2-thiouridine(34) oxidoreductase MnmC [Marinobacter sp.]MBE94973.1 bifunctional tRNA (5-methylaminomethyl-2-thiouridine)(34)-methyltransferase MnmD/FAD-dependent 5-carboxymethylaminomethyl-2-thiouridine(34) oxidoreductase MnmC [Marinobacter sp.]MBP53205.1 bifunctional tRNA (5-methylaminomethyl-2-thiouridine)(34)-methyltransferase MnmD/FAD-dependent 5-carboxymethylaminomethy|tara:strand:+ start:4679 stop:6595 length:1917 start_codon:yes stop_codon:yes gene_type:complete
MIVTDPRLPSIATADIDWSNGAPRCRRFGDVYFCSENGLEETRHVFIDQNRLRERFSLLTAASPFVIAETGFGTGLNFLAAWQVWDETATPRNGCLHFVSAERHPMTHDDLARALTLWPELKVYADQLLEQYPAPTSGVHRLVLAGGRVRLTLFFGDVADAWRELDFRADAWFLDGFAPAKNPGMWTSEVIDAIPGHSKPGTTLATFTSVGEVRRRLIAAGFTMRKVPGFGPKWDMLAGTLGDATSPETPPAANDVESIAIIGAGVAGSLLARNLAERGLHVTVIDRAQEAGTAASGNIQGALYVKLGIEFNDQAKLGLSSLLFSQRYYQQFGGEYWHPSGLVQLAHSDSEQDRQNRFITRNDYPNAVLQQISAEQASDLAGIPLTRGGLWFPRSGWLEPGGLCRALMAHERIFQCFGFDVHRLTPCNGKWHIAGNGEQDVVVDRVVICAGHQTPDLIPLKGDFRFRAIRGQVTHLPATAVKCPDVVVCGSGYLNPAHGGMTLAGATFDLHDPSPTLSIESHRDNLSMLDAMVPGAMDGDAGELDPASLDGKVGFRCTTHDYQPVAGPLMDARNQPLEGINLFTGLGSKGLSYAPLLAEYLADRLSGQPSCIPRSLAKRVATDRCHRVDITSQETISA